MRKDQKNPQIALFSAAFFTLALASCGSSERAPKRETPTPPAASEPDAAIVYVYVTPDDAAPPECKCLCNDSCFCSCVCGTNEPIIATVAGCVPASSGNEDAAPVQPVVDPPIDALAQNKDAVSPDASPDAAANKDVLVASDPPTDKPEAPVLPNADAGGDSLPDLAADKIAGQPDVLPDIAPDLTPPPDLPWGPEAQPCKSTTCLCPAGSACQPTALLSLNHLTDYSKLGYSGYFNSQSGFGLYTQETATSTWNIPTVTITAGTAPPWEVDITYVFTQVGLGVLTTNGTYNTPFYNWISARCQMTSQASACGCGGISLEVKGDISKPRPEAGLRLTLADIVCKDTAGNPLPAPDTKKDEIWWYNITQANVTADWKEIRIPVGSFVNGNVRSNDGMLDLGCIQAFEINYQFNVALNCGDGCVYTDIMAGSGHFEVRNITTY